MPELSAISLEGPRGVGKTATAERRCKTARYLDQPSQRVIAEADPAAVLAGDPPILIDEWQRVPEVWDAVRRSVDHGAGAGSYILTGSSAPGRAPTHTGAGRIVPLRLRPMTLAERGVETPAVSLSSLLDGTASSPAGSTTVALTDYAAEIARSGFPGIRTLSGRAHRMQLDGYLQRIIDTDFPEQGHPSRRPEILRRWLAAYAAATATTASYETIRDAATAGDGNKPAKTTTQPYRDVLERLWILDPVPAWIPSRNYLNRLSRSPKHHLTDPALAARAMGLEAGALLGAEGIIFGNLFESLVTLSIRVFAQKAEASVGHLRLHGGRHEVDLIVERQDKRILAIEVKLSSTVRDGDVENLKWLREKIGSDMIDAVVINTGPEAYRRKDGVAVIPAALLGP
ncbi:MAG: ATP-binding protein [Spirochaetaceae bacterium]|nr:MAG: ATP-binding protein [Spirochaetaceae bacterium]